MIRYMCVAIFNYLKLTLEHCIHQLPSQIVYKMSIVLSRLDCPTNIVISI
jgi:hypothetical protein